MAWINVLARVVAGHGVASGIANDPRFPEGTLAMQKPFFRERGLDLGKFHEGTLNLSIEPHQYAIRQAAFSFKQVNWSPDLPAEDFSFFNCRLKTEDMRKYVDGLVYYPHPETKPEFFQDPTTLEILTSFISDAHTDAVIDLQMPNAEMIIE
ncbi:MAG: hypothetical protein CMI31_06095 [Opitutae bacterium]|nr:hypothetical protein [Opitutae bacterium]|tara:strand:- start:1505 stop:1960 length:456 start_codon:yes stop_codon:yes gene_type:complete